MLLLVDKPKGITSHDVVDKVRKVTGERKVGHAGTLDPNATGLLIVGVGRQSTKKLGTIAKDTKKVYEAEVCLGEERNTDDAEGVALSKTEDLLPPSRKEVKDVLSMLTGKQKQTPPAYSAVKIKGRKAYELVRKGESVSLKARDVVVYSIELISYKYPILEIKCKVSSGTYIRALARDIGRKLGCGAYLRNLRRTKVGKYKVDDVVRLDYLSKDNIGSFTI